MKSTSTIPSSVSPWNDIKISFYKTLTDRTNTPISISDFFILIKTGKGFKAIVDEVRRETDKGRKDELKKGLPAITISALFNESRKARPVSYSGLICMDFDSLTNIQEIKARLTKDKFTFAVFLSPSGQGLKLLVKVSATIETHKYYFADLRQYYQYRHHITADPQCNDISRLTFLSFDKNLYENWNSDTWLSDTSTEKGVFNQTLDNLEKEGAFEKGNRNNFLFNLARNCRNNGLPQEDTLKFASKLLQDVDFKTSEIRTTVKSAFQPKSTDPGPTLSPTIQSGLTNLARVENYINSKYVIRFNIVSNEVESKKINTKDDFAPLNENSLNRELQHSNLNISLAKLSSLLQSDFVPVYNPFEEYFNSLGTWDINSEPDYIYELCKYIKVKDQPRFEKQFKKMLVRCVACALDDKVFNKQVFVFVHDMQNSGKSTLCRWLCPPRLFKYIAENISTDKDGLIALSTNIIINLDELATLSKSEVNNLKSVISKDKINVRLPFAKKATTMPRRASFFGSTNKSEFLTDETGSVRWLCNELTEPINFSYKQDINIDDIWRQANALYLSGFLYQLSPEDIEENDKANQAFQVISQESELISKYFAPSSKSENGEFKTATDIFLDLTGRHPPAKLNIYTIGKAMKILGFEKVSQYSEEKGHSEKGYYIKFR